MALISEQLFSFGRKTNSSFISLAYFYHHLQTFIETFCLFKNDVASERILKTHFLSIFDAANSQ
jgi:hypothetical protein